LELTLLKTKQYRHLDKESIKNIHWQFNIPRDKLEQRYTHRQRKQLIEWKIERLIVEIYNGQRVRKRERERERQRERVKIRDTKRLTTERENKKAQRLYGLIKTP
jgi:hypothetical protein